MKKINHYNDKVHLPLLIFLLLLCIIHKASAQTEMLLNAKLQNIAKPESVKGWIYFRDSFRANPATIFTDLKDAFELSENDRMIVKKIDKDGIGFRHYRYQQYYKGYKVLYGEYIVHQQSDNFVTAANGRLITGLKLNNTVLLTEKQALNTALNFMGAAKYMWQNPAMEEEFKRQQKDESATYYPTGELVYAPDIENENFSASGYHLTWCFKIYPNDNKILPKAVYIDASTGKVIYHTDLAISCSQGSGISTFNGTVSLNTHFALTSYNSHNDCQATDIYVYNCFGGFATSTFYSDEDNSWTSVSSQKSAVQAQWGAAQTYDYYNTIHQRQSWSGDAADMIVYNNANVPGMGVNNSCWGCNGLNVTLGSGGTGSATDDWNTDDIVGHEFTHGVTMATANLDYNKESGALNESFSDIFGEMVESWAEGNCDYKEGADKSTGAIRSFINPKSFGDPDTYLGTNWIPTVGCTPSVNNDQCGVHTNSGVQNHWFYLLSEGGSGTNDLGNAYNVKGITRFEARQIAYRALLYLISSSQYIDARRASLQAVTDLYGSCSQEAISVGDAWHAVGVESQSSEYAKNICGNYPASGYFAQAISTLTVANGCTTTITPTSNYVYFAARDKIVFKPGFTAQSGASFVAYINPCSSTAYRRVAPPMSDAEKGITNGTMPKLSVSKESEIINESISVAPNPFSTSVTISIYSKQNTVAQVIMYNAVGIKVKQRTGIRLLNGYNKISLDGSKLSQGVYMLEVNFGDTKTVKEIIKM